VQSFSSVTATGRSPRPQPEKRKVGGSTPPLTTSQLATRKPVTRHNVSHRWICVAFLVTVAARSRPSFAVRWGTRSARHMIISIRATGRANGSAGGESIGLLKIFND
jgi:hypothetical protein